MPLFIIFVAQVSIYHLLIVEEQNNLKESMEEVLFHQNIDADLGYLGPN